MKKPIEKSSIVLIMFAFVSIIFCSGGDCDSKGGGGCDSEVSSPQSNDMYWIEGGTKIVKAQNTQDATTEVFPAELSQANGVAVAGSHVYYTQDGYIGRDDNSQFINRYSTPPPPEFKKAASYRQRLGIVANTAYIFWTNNTPRSKTTTAFIGRATLDGEEVNENFISVPLQQANDIAITNDYIYVIGVADLLRKSKNTKLPLNYRVYRYNLPDGDGEELIYELNPNFGIYALDVSGDYLYAGTDGGTIARLKLSEKQVTELYFDSYGRSIRGIDVIGTKVYWTMQDVAKTAARDITANNTISSGVISNDSITNITILQNCSNAPSALDLVEGLPTAPSSKSSFRAELGMRGVELSWQEPQQVVNGFHIWRKDANSQEFKKITPLLISSQRGTGYDFYTYTDTAIDTRTENKNIQYKLQHIQVDGKKRFSEAVSIEK